MHALLVVTLGSVGREVKLLDQSEADEMECCVAVWRNPERSRNLKRRIPESVFLTNRPYQHCHMPLKGLNENTSYIPSFGR